MALTRDFKETVRARVQRDSAFRREMLRGGVECLVSGDVETGKIILRDYINATLGFTELASKTKNSPKSLMRMFGPSGNPNARNLLKVVEVLQKFEGVRFHLRATSDAA